ncbi:MAG: hypothetical protein QM533_06965 [Cytophagales bacterium]|nr:hypothetical protein [Cytophagales bacterium]
MIKTTPFKHELRLLLAIAVLVVIGFAGHFVFPIDPDAAKTLIANLGLHNDLGSHHFIDSRAWLGIPNAADVLSNLPFALLGIWGLLLQVKLRKPSQRLINRESFVLTLFFIGLIFTTIGSGLYHLAPSNETLVWDRAGMAFAFAGMLGIAASERISSRSGIWLGLASLLAGALSLIVWRQTNDVLPWSVLQFGSMAMVLALAVTRPTTKALGISLLWIVIFYGTAKVVEAADSFVFEATGHFVSGHTLKHLVASLAALPVIRSLILASQ